MMIFIAFGIFVATQAIAQVPNLIWAQTYGDTSSFNQSLDCTVDGLGNVYIVGYTNLMAK